MQRSISVPKKRVDLASNLLHLCKIPKISAQDVFHLVMSDGKDDSDKPNESRQGYLYESLCELLILCKCFNGLDYKEIREGQIQNHRQVTNCRALLNNNIHNGNNVADMILVQEESSTVLISMKYRGKFNPKDSDVSHLDNTSSKLTGGQTVKMSLIVKDANQVNGHKYTNAQNIHKQLHDQVIANGLLFDTTSVIAALAAFKESDLLKNSQNVEDLVETINADYLLSPRKQLVLKFHQKMAFLKFIDALTVSSSLQYCFAHKQRSGKSILLMSICKYLLETGLIHKILIMTSVPATLDSFKADLDCWIPFKHINYCEQDNISSLNADFKGIAFCSVQYLKMDAERKQQYLKNVGFDAIIIDESHLGSSTEKTRTGILTVDADTDTDASIEEIQKKARISIFASGTSDKTRAYYRIPAKHVDEWDMIDEAMMKKVQKETEENPEIQTFMEKKHGPFFSQCLADPNVNKDYSIMPVQVLMKHSIPEDIVKRIIEYNAKHGTKYGYSCSSFFALNQVQDPVTKKTKYQSAFELANTNDGEELLTAFFKSIIDSDPMNKAPIMKQIEETQATNGSRKSTRESPKLFLVYLPTHTRNNNIVQLQETILAFLSSHGLWVDYQLEFSNSGDDSGDVKEEYNAFIQTIMQRAKDNEKRGCVLFLGNKGGVGITYKDCDVTISLDDGHNLDNQKQRYSRALTDASGKTIGINVDMNIQRTYLFLADVLHRYKRNTKTTQTNGEILHYLYTQNVFLFDPQAINHGKISGVDMQAHFLKEAEFMMQSVTDDTKILDEICCDGDKLRDFIGENGWENRVLLKKNAFYEEMEGDQQDCPKGEKNKHAVDSEEASSDEDAEQEEHEPEQEQEQDEEVKQLVNQTEEMCKTFMFPLLALISRAYGIYDFKDIFTDAVTGPLVMSLLRDKVKQKKNEIKKKTTDLKETNFFIVQAVMSDIIDYNAHVVNDIREIYSTASPDQLRILIAKHFVPTEEEKKKNAEVSTPVKLVDDMINSVASEFWTRNICRVFEPCCGKGNFVLAIFDKLEEALRERFPDNEERCRHIINNCLYYADINSLNVFITTELLKCHVQSYCGLDESFTFNSYVGDSLSFDAKRHWKNVLGFHAVIGNPPYNSNGDVSTGNTIWQDFTRKALSHWVMPDGYLLFVHPSGWRKPNSERGRFNGLLDLMCKKNRMITLEIHGLEDGKKTFNCGTRYDWYLVQVSQPSQDALTKVRDEKGVTTLIDMTKFNWFPNSNVVEISELIATSPEDSLASLMVYSPSSYEHRKSWMSHDKNESAGFIHPCIHSTPKNGVRYMYSKVNDKGHFGVKKVIFGEGGIDSAVFDKDGEYGCTNGTFGIIVDSDEDGEALLALKDNEKFKKMLKESMCWSSFRVDWNMFKHFKKGFWVCF